MKKSSLAATLRVILFIISYTLVSCYFYSFPVLTDQCYEL